MTREEELDWLCRLKSGIYVYMPKEWLIPMNNALDMAIKALEQKPYEKFKSVKDHIYKLASDYKCWDNRLTQDEALELCHILEQEPCTLDDAREDFIYDVYKTLDFLPTNDEANRIIEVFDRVTSDIRQEPILDKIRAEIEQTTSRYCISRERGGSGQVEWSDRLIKESEVLEIIDKYKAESEDLEQADYL